MQQKPFSLSSKPNCIASASSSRNERQILRQDDQARHPILVYPGHAPILECVNRDQWVSQRVLYVLTKESSDRSSMGSYHR